MRSLQAWDETRGDERSKHEHPVLHRKKHALNGQLGTRQMSLINRELIQADRANFSTASIYALAGAHAMSKSTDAPKHPFPLTEHHPRPAP